MKRKYLTTAVVVSLLVAGVALVMLRNIPRARRPHGGQHAVRPEAEDQVLAAPSDANGAAARLVSSLDKVSASSLNWSRFRGPNGTGISQAKGIPTTWSDTENVLWRTALPGPGSSSPVLTDQYVFVTCYSGYGEDRAAAGNIGQLKRHVLCIQRSDGAIRWSRTIAAEAGEDPYRGMGVPEHGYATNSPVTDGQHLYVFFGKSGVVAFNLDGEELWRVSVGKESSNRQWGSAASLILVDNLLIVNAAEESQSLVALDKVTGAKVWQAPAASLELSYGTPALVHVDDSRDDLVLAVPGEVWGLNPQTGKLAWYVETSMTDNLSPSVIVDGDRIYAFGGYRSSGSIAIRAGGAGNVTNSHVLWKSRNTSYVATPVLVSGKLFWLDDRGMFYCADAATGELLERARTPGIASGERPVYASPIVIDDKIYAQTRNSGLFVLEPSAQLKVVAQNKFANDSSTFNATPAVDGQQLFLRSYSHLYCIGSASQ